MKPSLRLVVAPAITIVLLIAIIFAWRFLHPAKNQLISSHDPADAQNIGDFDAFQQSLASRVFQRFGADASGNDFSVVVATTAYPVGTLLRSSGSVPADLTDCVPQSAPIAFPAEHLFPAYTLNSDTALSANLGSHAIQGLDSAGVDLKQSSTIRYTIEKTAIQIMDDRSVETVTGQGECGKYISDHPGMRLIRGTVMGKISFTVKVDNPASVKAQLSKIGGFSINDNPGSSLLTISDDESQPIVELLSEFNHAPPGSNANPTPKAIASASIDRSPASVNSSPSPFPVTGPKVSSPPGSMPKVSGTPVNVAPPVPASVVAHMFIQQDKNDAPDAGANMIQSIRAAWPNARVEAKAQLIPSEKMPELAQVRYFNTSDLDRANKCLGILKSAYPNSRIVRIGLPSPEGQLEVWLPRAPAQPSSNSVK